MILCTALNDLVVSPPPRPAPAPPPRPAPGAAPVPGTGRPLVAVLGVRTVPAEVSSLPALITPHAGIKTSPAPAPGPRSGHGHPDSPPTDILAVSRSAGLVSVLLPLEHHEGEAGNTLGHPDLQDGAESLEYFLQVPLTGSTVRVGNVQSLPLQLL